MPACLANGRRNTPSPDAFRQDAQLGRGVNILGYDPIWKDRQKARFQEKCFRLIKEAGLKQRQDQSASLSRWAPGGGP